MVAPTATIEVKGCRRRDWPRFGRRIDLGQFNRSRADVFAWCIVEDDLSSRVWFDGWLPRAEMGHEQAPRRYGMPGESWLRVAIPSRAPRDLLTWLTDHSPRMP